MTKPADKENIEIIVTIKIKIPLWDAIKLRIAGRGGDTLAREIADRIKASSDAAPETE